MNVLFANSDLETHHHWPCIQHKSYEKSFLQPFSAVFVAPSTYLVIRERVSFLKNWISLINNAYYNIKCMQLPQMEMEFAKTKQLRTRVTGWHNTCIALSLQNKNCNLGTPNILFRNRYIKMSSLHHSWALFTVTYLSPEPRRTHVAIMCN